MMQRIGLDIFLVLSFVFLPWFVSVPLIFLGCIFIVDFYEGILLAAVFDLIHGSGVGNVIPVVALSALGVFALGPFLRTHLRWYS